MQTVAKLILLYLVLSINPLFTQTLPGKLLLVGGGSENPGKWSDAPYGWAVEQSSNKRVAIITYETNPTQWLPDYFKSLGAAEANNFTITSASVANQQQTYDSLITYDVIFFKGGDQKQYYNMYKNTLTHAAVEHVFNQGGVIGGTSAGEMVLSKVLFTAQNGTVYSHEAIANPNNQYMTLADDFLAMMPGYIFDSHFVERGRFGRLIGFLGNWKLNKNEDIIGIGVDDKTAFCIDQNLIGYAFGTGAANIYKAAADNQFSLGGTKLLATNLEVIQLLNGCTINFNTLEVQGYTDYFPTKYVGENFGGYVLISGSDNVNKNQQFIERFAEAISADSILIITGASTALAEQFRTKFQQINAFSEVLQAIPENYSSAYFIGKVERISKILFVNNTYATLMDFLENSDAGSLLIQKMFNSEKTIGFVGDNSRFAGGSVLVNYNQQYASYDGLLEFDQGIGLLKSMIVMPKTFENSDIEENAAAGVPFGMLLDSLKYGIWLHDNAFAEYKVNSLNETTITSFGSYPMMFLESGGTYGGFSDQSAVNSGRPRNVAGFEKLNMALMDESMVKTLGYYSSVNETPGEGRLFVYPNPANSFVNITFKKGSYHLKIISIEGKVVLQQTLPESCQINVSALQNGLYLLIASDPEKGLNYKQKLIISR